MYIFILIEALTSPDHLEYVAYKELQMQLYFIIFHVLNVI